MILIRNKNKIKFILLKKNIGLPKARNLGIKKSIGELICCLDADDYLDKKYLEMIFGLYFASMGIFNYGCAAGFCGNPKANNNVQITDKVNNEITFEEIK